MKLKKVRGEYKIIFNLFDLANIEDCDLELIGFDEFANEIQLTVPEKGCIVKIRHPTVGAILLKGNFE